MVNPKNLVVGLHAITSLLKSQPDSVELIHVQRGRDDQRVQKILSMAEKHNIAVQRSERRKLDSLADGDTHQGVVAEVSQTHNRLESDLDSIVAGAGDKALILMLDGVTDPHNLGACLRTADAAGVNAVVIPKDNSVGMTPAVKKVASGAAEHVPLIVVTNIARTLKSLQTQGLWVSGAAGEADVDLYSCDLTGPRVIVMGAEGAGLRRLTRETCDELVSIPMYGHVSSLNVSVATGLFLYEVNRQRHAK